jgi:hypothetical protein
LLDQIILSELQDLEVKLEDGLQVEVVDKETVMDLVVFGMDHLLNLVDHMLVPVVAVVLVVMVFKQLVVEEVEEEIPVILVGVDQVLLQFVIKSVR